MNYAVFHMTRTKLSSRNQVTIPKNVRSQMGLKPGQEMRVIAKGGLVILIPERPISAMRGFARGIPTTGFREKKDRF